jgi:hypothetical protein
MLAYNDRIYFTDPFADKVPQTKQVLVTDALNPQRRYEFANAIVDVKKTRHLSRGQLWYITTEGDWVDGVPLNPVMSPGTPVLGLLGDAFVVGESLYIGARTDIAEITEPVRSDQKVLHAADGEGYRQPRQPVAQWVAAAPWAKELMPCVDDADTVVEAKLALARSKWEHARTKAALTGEATDRGWPERIEQLTSRGSKMPTPRYGGYVSAQLQIPVETPQAALDTPAFRAIKERVSEVSGAIPWTGQAYVSLAVAFPADVHLEEPDFNNVHNDSYQRTARALFDIPGARIQNAEPEAFIRTLTDY